MDFYDKEMTNVVNGSQTNPQNYRYEISGMAIIINPRTNLADSVEIKKTYVSSLLEGRLEKEELAPSGFNAIQLAREDGIIPTMCRNLGTTNKPIDPRLDHYGPYQQYVHPLLREAI